MAESKAWAARTPSPASAPRSATCASSFPRRARPRTMHKAQQAREASDLRPSAGREGRSSSRGAPRGPRAALKDARKDAKAQKGRADAAETGAEEAAGPGQARGQGHHGEVDSRERAITKVPARGSSERGSRRRTRRRRKRKRRPRPRASLEASRRAKANSTRP